MLGPARNFCTLPSQRNLGRIHQWVHLDWTSKLRGLPWSLRGKGDPNRKHCYISWARYTQPYSCLLSCLLLAWCLLILVHSGEITWEGPFKDVSGLVFFASSIVRQAFCHYDLNAPVWLKSRWISADWYFLHPQLSDRHFDILISPSFQRDLNPVE